MALRIKSDIDLKELEKFGFEDIKNKSYFFVKRIGIASIRVNKNGFLETWNNFNEFSNEEMLKTINDLIKADLVEKVSD